MSITKDLNVTPYFDDFDEAKQFYRILFKPAVALQARELTQLQTILQHQIEQFGDNIFKEGSIIKGVNLTEVNELKYVKLRDTTTVSLSDYFDQDEQYFLNGETSGLQAEIVYGSAGTEAASPDLNTFYIKYINSNDSTQEFIAGETVTITNSSDVEQASLTVAPSSFTNVVGSSFGIRCTEGYIYQKGAFLYVEPQITIVSKYTNVPDGKSVGFKVNESFVTSVLDSSLNDNAAGFNNENAPGADRLKMEPILTVIDSADSEAEENFFTLLKYDLGFATTIRDVSQYNLLGEEMARRTFDESGNYIVDDFKMNVEKRANLLTGNTADQKLYVRIGPGKAYVNGYKVENHADQYKLVDQLSVDNIVANEYQGVQTIYGSFLEAYANSITGKVVDINSFTPVYLHNANSDVIASAIVRNVTREDSGDVRFYLSDIIMSNPTDNISDTATINYLSSDIATVRQYNSGAKLKKTRKDVLVYPVGNEGVKLFNNLDIVVRRFESWSASPANNEFTISLSDPSEVFDDTGSVHPNDFKRFVVLDQANSIVEISDITISANNSEATFTLANTSVVTGGYVYYDVKMLDATPADKQANTFFVKVVYNDAVKKYWLGVPDVYRINSIIDLDNSNNDVTESFYLNPNQKDTFYDYSYMTKVAGSEPITDGNELLVSLSAYKLNTTSGYGFFTVDSYPSNTYNYIPDFVSSKGDEYDLRNCIDFRPFVANTVVYTANSELANTVANTEPTRTFVANTILIPAFKATSNVNYDYYLPRIDNIIVDSLGEFSIIKGTPSEFPTPPEEASEGMVIGTIYVPTFPALSPTEAQALGKLDNAIRLEFKGTQGYTMEEISEIDKKVDQLAYYVSLNALEQETADLTILDENGNERFKNGILVDNFSDVSVCDLKNEDFDASIDRGLDLLQPPLTQFMLDVSYSAADSSNTELHDDCVTLQTEDDVVLMSQPHATKARNPVSTFNTNEGFAKVWPEYDYGYDVVTNPRVDMTVDTDTNLAVALANVHRIIPITNSAGKKSKASQREKVASGVSKDARKRMREISERLTTGGKRKQQRAVGYLTDKERVPYIRSRLIRLVVHGLRSNTVHHIFMDNINIDAYSAPGKAGSSSSAKDVKRKGAFGAELKSDSNGVLRAVIRPPRNTFAVGEKVIEIADVSLASSLEDSTSRAKAVYTAYNFTFEDKGNETRSSKSKNIAPVETTRSVTDRPETVLPAYGLGSNDEPTAL